MKKMTDEELYALAKKRILAKKAFNIHLATFIVVSILLVAISLYNNSLWFIFAVGGWGIGVIAHRFALNSILNSGDEIEREFNQLKNKNN